MRLTTWICLVFAMSCVGDIEGDAPGECSDQADNDRDGMFDCDDPDCKGSPVCDGVVDTTDTDDTVVATPTPTDSPTPTPTEDPTPTPVPDDPLDFGWDGQPDRPPGPHHLERDQISIWEIHERTAGREYGPFCIDQTSDDWLPLFDQAAPNLRIDEVSEVYHYMFVVVDPTELEARNLDCSRPGDSFPDCPYGSFEYDIDADDGTLTTPISVINTPIPQVPGCSIEATTSLTIVDNGVDGVQENQVAFTTTPACPADLAVNNGCVVTYTYELEWTRSQPLP